MNNKELDNLFITKLSNLEASPSKKVWNGIEAKLAQKKKRRVFPFWWFSAAAAIIVLTFFIINPLNETNKLDVKPVIEITNTPIKSKPIEDKSKNIVPLNSNETSSSATNNLMIKNNGIAKNTTKQMMVIKENRRSFSKYIYLNKIQVKKQFKLDNNFNKPHFTSKKNKENLNVFIATQKNEKKRVNSNKKEQWSIAPVFGVLSANSFTKSSPISENLASNTAGEGSTNFGIQVAYQINKKWAIQTGVQLLNMSFSNAGVAVFNSPDNNPTAVTIGGESLSFYANNFLETASLDTNSITDIISTSSNLNQNFGYIEIPLEIKYLLIQKNRFSSNIITGFSTLFLNENEILLSYENFTTNGKFTTLNALNFSGNFGFDFNYLLDTKWSFHVNPMLKVQLNTFNDAHNFSPFNIGVYSGIRYRF